jgi:hypothetical protein
MTVGSNRIGTRFNAGRAAAINLESAAFSDSRSGFRFWPGGDSTLRMGLAPVCVLAPAGAPIHTYPLLSMPRFTLVGFPIFIAPAAPVRASEPSA